MALIETRDLYKIYDVGESPVHALDGVSLSIERGEFVAVYDGAAVAPAQLQLQATLADGSTRAFADIRRLNWRTASGARLPAR
mgnify:CR=1 FL=1